MGSQLTINDSLVCRNACWIICSLLRRLAWVTMTPFGSDVAPEVYCSSASVLAPIWGSRQVLPASLAIRVVSISSILSCTKLFSIVLLLTGNSPDVNATVGWQSETTADNRSCPRVLPCASHGTGVTPAYRHPMKPHM